MIEKDCCGFWIKSVLSIEYVNYVPRIKTSGASIRLLKISHLSNEKAFFLIGNSVGLRSQTKSVVSLRTHIFVILSY
ncbi:TPA: hypothetical protein HA241_04485 [Candidatus Woesearchaeota archaeon]|nr:hypothetical protein [Candidatus Woesearchaeota archaeon]